MRSWGTEGRCTAAGQPQDEVPGSEKVYDYIVFRAADVVDLRIDDPSPAQPETPAAEPSPAAVPAAPSVRIGPWCLRGRTHTDVKWISIYAVRERFFHVDSSAAFLLISPAAPKSTY